MHILNWIPNNVEPSSALMISEKLLRFIAVIYPRFPILRVGSADPSVTFGYFCIFTDWVCQKSIFVHSVVETSKGRRTLNYNMVYFQCQIATIYGINDYRDFN